MLKQPPWYLNDWSLKPSGLGVGDEFRLIFLSSTKRNATSSNIGTYNTWIQDAEPRPAMTTSRHTATDSRSSAAPGPRMPATTLPPPIYQHRQRAYPSTG